MAADHRSTGRNIRDLRRVFRVKERLVYLREAYTVASSFVCTSPLAVTTVVGFLGTVTVSKSAEFRSFLLNMCMLAPESTTNCLSSGFIVDGAGKLHSVVGEKNVALSVSLSLKMCLANILASPRAHIALVFQSLRET